MASFFKRYFEASKWCDGLACQVCLRKYKIFAEFKRHIFSKEHQKKMTEVFETEGHSLHGKVPLIIIMDRSFHQTNQHPILGLQLLTVCFSRGMDNVLYLCHVCEELVTGQDILEHITSSFHKCNYYSFRDSIDTERRKNLKQANVDKVGPLKILNLPYWLTATYASSTYFQVMTWLGMFVQLPTLLEDVKPMLETEKEYQKVHNKCPLPDSAEKSYKIRCQNCNIQCYKSKEYLQHVQSEAHKKTMKSIAGHSNMNSSADMQETKDGVPCPPSLQNILNQLGQHKQRGVSMMVFCHSSAAPASKAVCVCFACQDVVPQSTLAKHLNSHKHFLKTLLHLNPWRLPFGWREVLGRRFLQSEVEAEEKERGWSWVVVKVMDLPSSMLKTINSPSYQNVMDKLSSHAVVMKRNVPVCQTFSRLHEHKTFPLLGCNFLVSYEVHDAARHATYNSVLCLLCGRRLTDQEGYAHVFSWEHVFMFLDRFHPDSVRIGCGVKVLLEQAAQAARLRNVSFIQTITLDKPIEEPCDYNKVKLILSAAKRKRSNSPLMPLVLSRAVLVPKETVTSSTASNSKEPAHSSKNTNESPKDSNQTSSLQKSETRQQKSGRGTAEGEEKRPGEALDDKPECKRQRRSAREIPPHEEKPSKSTLHGLAPLSTSKSTTDSHGATGTKTIHAPTGTKPTLSNSINGTAPVAPCAATSKCVVTQSSPKPSLVVSPSLHEVPKAEPKSDASPSASSTAQKNPAAEAGVGSQKPEVPSSKKVNIKGVVNSDTEAWVCKTRLFARRRTATAQPSHSKAKQTLSKVGLGFIVAVNSDGRKQSYCTLCHIRLDRSSHPTENIHFHNYIKRRFPEVDDRHLVGINLEKLAFSFTEVEKSLGLRNIQTIEVSEEEYNELSSLSEAQALQRLENQFRVGSKSLILVGQDSSLTSTQGSSTLEEASDTEVHVSTADDELKPVLEKIHGLKCKELSETHCLDYIDLTLDEENLEGFEPSTSVPLRQQLQTDELPINDAEKNVDGSDEPSPSVSLVPDSKIEPILNAEENLPYLSEPSPPLVSGLQPGDPNLKGVETNPGGSDTLSPPEPSGSDPHVSGPGPTLQGPNRSSRLSLVGQDRAKSPVGKYKGEKWRSPNQSVSQAVLLAGTASNLTMFLWVRGLSVIGLASVYECRGTSSSFYLCTSCRQKFTVSGICQHMVSVEHQSTYMKKEFPHFLETFWYEADLVEEMKLDIFNDIAVKVAAEERDKKMDAKVVLLLDEMYEHVWNAPAEEALTMLQSAMSQSDSSSQQIEASQASEKHSAHDMELCGDQNDVLLSSATSAVVSPQESGRSFQSPTQAPISSWVSSTRPFIKVEGEAVHSQCRPENKSDLLNQTPPLIQVKKELIPVESKVPVALAKKQPSLQVEPELRSPASGSGTTPGPTSVETSTFQVNVDLNPSKSKPLRTGGSISKVQAELLPQESQSLKTSEETVCPASAKLVSEVRPEFQVKQELMPQELTAGPSYGVSAEPAMAERGAPTLQPPWIGQVKEKNVPLDSVTSVTTRLRSETEPNCQLKTLLLEDLSTPSSSGAEPSSQAKDDLTRSQGKLHATEMPSHFWVKEQARAKGGASLAATSTIRQDKSLPTRKRESLESLDQLIWICSNKTPLPEPMLVKNGLKSSQAKVAKIAVVEPSGDPAHGDPEKSKAADNRSNPAAMVMSKGSQDVKSGTINPWTQQVTLDALPHKSVNCMEKSTNTVVPCDLNWPGEVIVKPDTSCVDAGPDNVVPQGFGNPAEKQIPVSSGMIAADHQASFAGPTAKQPQPLNPGSCQIPPVLNVQPGYDHRPAMNVAAESSCNNVGQTYPVQFYIQQAPNRGAVGVSEQTAAWQRHPMQPQLLQQLPYQRLPWLPANVTNSAPHLWTHHYGSYFATPITLWDVMSQPSPPK
ncbi:uncharacterized protein LOC133144870 [Syngnathus typhle]|uniref:uncharacterized protein LOC133144870 n=1 Tax=Syngnathus typhle TaxID=161592 RepID=UPI002A6AA722|nr:uncharacterized protein LOC133144870 [Syngnathus typhle]